MAIISWCYSKRRHIVYKQHWNTVTLRKSHWNPNNPMAMCTQTYPVNFFRSGRSFRRAVSLVDGSVTVVAESRDAGVERVQCSVTLRSYPSSVLRRSRCGGKTSAANVDSYNGRRVAELCVIFCYMQNSVLRLAELNLASCDSQPLVFSWTVGDTCTSGNWELRQRVELLYSFQSCSHLFGISMVPMSLLYVPGICIKQMRLIWNWFQ